MDLCWTESLNSLKNLSLDLLPRLVKQEPARNDTLSEFPYKKPIRSDHKANETYAAQTTWTRVHESEKPHFELQRRRRRRRLKGIHSRPDTNRTGVEGLSFYYTRLLHCLDQMLAVMLLSQYRVSSSKTVRPRAPYGARCIRHVVSTWFAVCSKAPHSQFGEGARPHLCMDEWNRPTSVRRRLSLTQAARSKPIPTGLATVSGTKARSLEAFSQYSTFHL